MIECPELGALEATPLPPQLRDHVSACGSCRLVIEVFEGGGLDVEDCVRFDALLAARADGTLGTAGRNLLDRHLASCASCRAVAETLSPTQDADGDHAALPEVDPAAYALGLEVARGGMGRILAARDLRVGRPIAIKELLGRSPQLAARFEREARVTARLQHPGIVPIYEIGKWPDGTPFYSMRMVDGRTLADAIDSAKTLDARLALLPAMIAATEAVAFAHAKRVIHRDLTPSNILVGAYGETVVIDWGLAKDLAAEAPEEDDDVVGPETSNEKLTGVGAVIGTATYMPPEQAHAIPVDERADVYALGAILYHVLAGAPPYRAKSARELLRAVKTAPPPPIDEVQPGTPRDLVSIITKAMARDPDARYPSARELADELKRFQTGRLVEAHAYSRYELVKRFLRRHRAVVTVSALALAISMTFGAIAVVNVLRSRAEARDTVRELILEKGRIELLAGNTQRALAYLHDAYQRGDASPPLQFLLGSALRGLSSSVYTLDCGGNVRTIAFDSGGKYVAAGCTEVAKVWRLADGRELASVKTGDVGFSQVRFSPDATALATWGESGVARLWHPETGELRGTFDHRATGGATDHEVEINRLSFTPDGARLATTGTDGLAILWDVARQAPIRTIVGSTAPLRAVRSMYGWLDARGKRLYSMTPMGAGYGWDVETGEPLGVREHGSVAIGADLSADGRLGLSCGADGRIRTWDLETGNQLHELTAHTAPVWKCIFSSDSKLVLSGGHDGRANVYDLTTGQAITAVQHGDIVVNASFAPDARRFATVGISGRVKLWDTRTGALLANLDAVRGKDARFAPDNQHLVAARGDGRIQIWRFERPSSIAAPSTAQLGAGGTHAAFDVAVSGVLEVRDLVHNRAITTARELAAPYAIADAAPIVAGAYGGGVRVIEMRGETPPRDLARGRAFDTLRLSADGARVVLERAGAAPEVWDVASGKHLATLTGARHALLSEDGRRAIAWTPAQRPVLWDIDGNRAGVTLATAGAYQPLGLARRGTRVALLETSGARRVSLWNANTGAKIAERPDSSSAPSFDPTRHWLTSIDADRGVTVWSTDDGENHASFLGEQLTHAMVNPQGTFVAAIAEYGTVALLMSATDGRILARWPLEHTRPEIGEDGFKPPSGTVTWTRDGAAVVSHAATLSVWQVANRYTAADIAKLVRRNVPWRVENGELTWIRNGKLQGTVVRDGEPVAHTAILVEIRTPPDIGAAPINWESSKNRVSTRKITTNAAGEFSLENLLPGQYTLTIGDHKFFEHVSAEDEPITITLP